MTFAIWLRHFNCKIAIIANNVKCLSIAWKIARSNTPVGLPRCWAIPLVYPCEWQNQILKKLLVSRYWGVSIQIKITQTINLLIVYPEAWYICHGSTLTCIRTATFSLPPADLSVSTKAKPAGGIKSRSVHRLGTAYFSNMANTRYSRAFTIDICG